MMFSFKTCWILLASSCASCVFSRTCRDYFQDVEAVVASKNPSFQLKSLIVWTDLVEPPTLPSCLQGEESTDLLAAQEQAAASKFSEIKVKLASDYKAMNTFNAEKTQVAGKQHVAKVLHQKAQNEAGAKLLHFSLMTRFSMNNLEFCLSLEPIHALCP